MRRSLTFLFVLLWHPSQYLSLGFPSSPVHDLEVNSRRFEQKIATLRWIDYTPSTFDPRGKVRVNREDITADLKALLANGFVAANTGICTYSCSPESGLDAVPEIVRDLKFGGLILAVWSIDDRMEIEAAKRLAAAGLVDAICAGNEGLEIRYTWKELRQVMRDLRASTKLPISTSEQVDDYGLKELTDPKEVDWLYPNIHPVFHQKVDPVVASDWAHMRAGKLARRTKLPLLVHETGWPTKGLRRHSPAEQRVFWANLLAPGKEAGYRFVIFEAFDQPWKHEPFQGVDVGMSWGIFDAGKRPKPVVKVLVKQDEAAAAPSPPEARQSPDAGR